MGELRINLTNFITVGIMAVLFSYLVTKAAPAIGSIIGKGGANA